MENSKPNILIIHADQHRADCIGANGNQDIKTPNLDKLASDGVNYQNCFCTLPVCTPSRYSLLTGLYVHQHMGWSNHCTLPNGLDTFPRLLKNAGYSTKAVGKMHFAPTYLDVGFENMILAEQDGPGRFEDDYHRFLKDNKVVDGADCLDQIHELRKDAHPGYRESISAEASDLKGDLFNTDWIAQHAIEEIESWKSGGHMMMVGFIKPHHPYDVPEPWDNMYDPQAMNLLPGWTSSPNELENKYHKGFFDNNLLTEEQVKRGQSRYFGSISQIDDYLGKMIGILKQNGVYENTLIVYTSDHGDYMGFHHMILKSNYMYDPLARVPAIVKYPKNKNAGVVSKGLLSVVDLTSAIIDEAGLPQPKSIAGKVPNPDFSRDYVYCESGHHHYMIRDQHYKLLYCKEHSFDQFFDLANDPHEHTNLIHDEKYQAVIARLKAALLNWLAFETPSPIHLDLKAPIIPAKNAQRLDSDGKAVMRDYLFDGTKKYVASKMQAK